MNKDSSPTQAALIEALTEILRQGEAGTQQEIAKALKLKGLAINQSKISRILQKLTAIKVKNSQGQTVYRLPKESDPPPTQTPLTKLILKISANETLVVIKTSPGSASLIARMLDYQNSDSEILATLAGDDTIFVAPKTVSKINETIKEINLLLKLVN